MSIVNLLILVLIVLVMVYLRKRFGWAGRMMKKVMISIGVIFVIYLVLIFTGSPLLYEYFEYGRCSGWCWGPKNEKGEYTILYTKFGSKMRHLKGAGMFGYKRIGYFSDIWQVNVDGSNNRRLFTAEEIKGSLNDYCHKTNEIVGMRKGNMWVARFDGSNTRCILSEPPEERIYKVRFSPDGKLIAYISYDKMEKKDYLWVVDVEGRWRKRLWRTEMLAWHPSGKYLATGGKIIDLEGNKVCQFPVGVPHPCFSPDGGYLVGYTQMLRIKREIKDGKEVWKAEEMPIAPGADKFPKWSPCGRYIINGWEGGIRLVDLLIGTTVVSSITPGQIPDPGYDKREGEDLAKFRSYIKKNDPQWWNNMVDKFPNLNLEYVK